MATLKLATLVDIAFFNVFGAILVVALALMWGLVAVKTIRGAWRGALFVSPCISGLRK